MNTKNKVYADCLAVLQSLKFADDSEIENPNATAVIDKLIDRIEASKLANDEYQIEDAEETLEWFYHTYGFLSDQPYHVIEILLNHELREKLIEFLRNNAIAKDEDDIQATILERWEWMYPDAKAKIVCSLISAYEEALNIEFWNSPMPYASRLN